eukprot:TRINITY_DN7838_c0_g1_i1.p1 TRINITY_DN7838_c0_g1~~TRINITY_DN7838_c0_g1_i1.p1  ORF type:complete len:198 (-),score=53.83 TRINITY_DN7838_c0_g1_i1:27-575(-)
MIKAGPAIPSLTSSDAGKTLDFIKAVLDGVVEMREDMPDGRVLHSRVVVGGSPIFVSSEFPDWGLSDVSPDNNNNKRTAYVNLTATSPENVDKLVAKARECGGTADDAEDMFWGDRFATIRGPCGQAFGICAEISAERTKVASDAWEAQKAAMAAAAASGKRDADEGDEQPPAKKANKADEE